MVRQVFAVGSGQDGASGEGQRLHAVVQRGDLGEAAVPGALVIRLDDGVEVLADAVGGEAAVRGVHLLAGPAVGRRTFGARPPTICCTTPR
ncbi:hypothetical protein ACFWD7_53690 [Streptomyces mirabilis]|uniref:hypothetical protein n=1 Tax=Streptomyces mirabilis TaxID=68239 RepID=UPI00367FCA1F